MARLMSCAFDAQRSANEKLSVQVLDLAKTAGLTVGTAESCTGGMVASALTDIPGSSECMVGGVVSYWVDVKEAVLGVPASTIRDYGVVSEQTARAMAEGARRALGCDFAVATTGIAGPGGAEPGKPVGTVCYAVAGPVRTESLTVCEGGSRAEVRIAAVGIALDFLKRALEQNS